MKENIENIKVGLLGVIAVTMIINTFMMAGGDDNTPARRVSKVAAPNVSTQTANQSPAITPTPNTNTPNRQKQEPAGPTTSIQFAEAAHDFGTIKQDTENKHIFRFTNTGSEPLIIENAKGSCGCTVPTYPKEPVAPGETGEIEVVYKPGKQKGKQTKTVTVTANTEPKNTRVKITANVEEV